LGGGKKPPPKKQTQIFGAQEKHPLRLYKSPHNVNDHMLVYKNIGVGYFLFLFSRTPNFVLKTTRGTLNWKKNITWSSTLHTKMKKERIKGSTRFLFPKSWQETQKDIYRRHFVQNLFNENEAFFLFKAFVFYTGSFFYIFSSVS
jgi:hypothetical protein